MSGLSECFNRREVLGSHFGFSIMRQPRSVTSDGGAPAIVVYLPPEVLAEIDRMAAASGKKTLWRGQRSGDGGGAE
jgi:hypothetical protein